jgi:hypothetical protein
VTAKVDVTSVVDLRTATARMTLDLTLSRQSSAVSGSWQTSFYRGLQVCSANVDVGRYVRVGAQGHISRLLVKLHRANRTQAGLVARDAELAPAPDRDPGAQGALT